MSQLRGGLPGPMTAATEANFLTRWADGMPSGSVCATFFGTTRIDSKVSDHREKHVRGSMALENWALQAFVWVGQITVAKLGGIAREFQNDFHGAGFAAALRKD